MTKKMTIDELIAHLGNMTTDQDDNPEWVQGIEDARTAIRENSKALKAGIGGGIDGNTLVDLRAALSIAWYEHSLDANLGDVLDLIDGKPNKIDEVLT